VLDRLLIGTPGAAAQARLANIANQIQQLDADILCLIEGPKGEAAIQAFCANHLGGAWTPVLAADGVYATQGRQWIWFLVKPLLAASASLLPVKTFDALAGASWTVNYWGETDPKAHRHYRHPQILVLDLNGTRVEFVGLHLESKFVNNGEKLWGGNADEHRKFVVEALRARVKLATEVVNVRRYIDARFGQTANPAIFVMGDLNDGPGKEWIEQQFLFFDRCRTSRETCSSPGSS
jgi:hypothetical protein